MNDRLLPTVALRDGTRWPALGLGTWRMGESAARRPAEVAAVRRALQIGYRLFDTAEMYGEGGAETVLGLALAEAFRSGLKRDEVVVVSKAYPHHAGRRELVAACERSLARLGLSRLDLYLLHWRGEVPLRETVAGFEELLRRGLIARWGVSNFDVDDLEELEAVPGGAVCAVNQVWHSLGERGPEFALLPWMRERGMPLMAYSPIDQGALAGADAPPVLARLAERHGAAAAQVALAALLAQPGVIAIPKAMRDPHLQQNWDAQRLVLDEADHAALDQAFPPPRRKPPLAMN